MNLPSHLTNTRGASHMTDPQSHHGAQRSFLAAQTMSPDDWQHLSNSRFTSEHTADKERSDHDKNMYADSRERAADHGVEGSASLAQNAPKEVQTSNIVKEDNHVVTSNHVEQDGCVIANQYVERSNHEITSKNQLQDIHSITRNSAEQTPSSGAVLSALSEPDRQFTHTPSFSGANVNPQDEQHYNRPNSWRRNTQNALNVLRRHLSFVGPGIVASVAYTDPGNWVTDLAAGSEFGYALLFVVLLSGIFGIFLQILAVRLGVVTGSDLARSTRYLLLPDEWARGERVPSSQTTQPVRFRALRKGVLWVLYGVSEAAIVATELAELLGSAIALNLLFPGLPLWGGVLVTSADVLLILLVYRPNGNFRIFEIMIGLLVLVVMACYIALIVRVKPHWPTVFRGYVPSATMVKPQALYTGVGIIGAVIMPHALYLGSHFSTINRINRAESVASQDDATSFHKMRKVLPSLARQVRAVLDGMDWRSSALSSSNHAVSHSHNVPETLRTTPRLSSFQTLHDRMSIAEMRTTLPHAAWDISLSLFFLAITINSAILIVAGAAFYYGSGSREVGDLYDAYDLLHDTLGKAYAVLFAIALLAAGQAASITCTLAGQIVSEGFINWRTNPFVRRLLTRIVTIVPSLTIAIAVGRSGLDDALVGSQVALSFALPFVIVPLVLVTSMKSRMTVTEDYDQEAAQNTSSAHPTADVPVNQTEQSSVSVQVASQARANSAKDAEACPRPLSEVQPTESPRIGCVSEADVPEMQEETQSFDFTNGMLVKLCASIIFLVVVVADFYTLVTTIAGEQ